MENSIFEYWHLIVLFIVYNAFTLYISVNDRRLMEFVRSFHNDEGVTEQDLVHAKNMYRVTTSCCVMWLLTWYTIITFNKQNRSSKTPFSKYFRENYQKQFNKLVVIRVFKRAPISTLLFVVVSATFEFFKWLLVLVVISMSFNSTAYASEKSFKKQYKSHVVIALKRAINNRGLIRIMT